MLKNEWVFVDDVSKSQVVKNLYDKATSAVLFNSSIGDWFQTTVGV